MVHQRDGGNKWKNIFVKDTEEIIGWKSLKREELDECWKEIAVTFEEEVPIKYKVEDSKSEAYRGRGAPLELRIVRRSKKYRFQKWGEDC